MQQYNSVGHGMRVIQKEFMQRERTPRSLEVMKQAFKELFRQFDLEDFQYVLIEEEDEIVFKAVGQLNTYALMGMLYEDKL